MDFTKFSKEELIGRTVLISNRNWGLLKKISRVTKTHFQCEGSESKYRLSSGTETGGDGWNMVSATLLTEGQAKEWLVQERIKKEMMEMYDKIKKELLPKATHSQLSKIIELLSKNL